MGKRYAVLIDLQRKLMHKLSRADFNWTEKRANHEAKSLETLVENLVKNWEIEASHKMDVSEWRTVDPKKYTFAINGGPPQDAEHMLKVCVALLLSRPPSPWLPPRRLCYHQFASDDDCRKEKEGKGGKGKVRGEFCFLFPDKVADDESNSSGTYSAVIAPNKYYGANSTFDESHKTFRDMMPNFAWEVLEVYSGPPVVAFKWRHWGWMKGDYVGKNEDGSTVTIKAHRGILDIQGVTVAKLNEKLQVTSLETW